MNASRLLLTLLILCVAPAMLAQDDCPTIITTALETVDAACSETARNQLCYGNITLDATPREGAADFRFEQTGDVVEITSIKGLQLSSFSLTSREWGVALMKIQANLPNTLPGQNVTFLLFGDVTMQDAGTESVEVPVTATSGVNVRLRPTTDASVIRALSNGQEVMATGRLSDGSWVRVRLDDSSVGWVSADFLDGDLNRLLPADLDAPAYGPMQAFTFTSTLGDAPCAEAPDSGILIRTPEGAVTIQLRVNNVDIQLGSTVYLQAVPGDAMRATVIEGAATLNAFGESQVVPAGTFSTVPLDASGRADGPPDYPQPYDMGDMQALPLQLALFDQVTLAASVSTSDIPAAIDIATGVPPLRGRWRHTETVTHVPLAVCGLTIRESLGQVGILSPIITFSENRATIDVPLPLTVRMYRTSELSYSGTYNGTVWELTFTSPTTYVGTWTGWPDNPDCSLDSEFVGEYQP